MSTLFKNVNVISMHVIDFEAAKKWYNDILEWPVVFSSDEAGWHEYGRPNETHISLNRWDPTWGPVPQRGATPVFAVDNAHDTIIALRARGVKCDDVVVIPGMVHYGTFYDPEGNSLQVASNG
jgi:catechol-2,3-dioxygenase